VGAIAAPFMLMLGSQLRIGSPVFLPYLVFGAISCLAGLLVLLLPVSWQHAGAMQSMLAGQQPGEIINYTALSMLTSSMPDCTQETYPALPPQLSITAGDAASAALRQQSDHHGPAQVALCLCTDMSVLLV
jgi:hypothetical protein